MSDYNVLGSKQQDAAGSKDQKDQGQQSQRQETQGGFGQHNQQQKTEQQRQDDQRLTELRREVQERDLRHRDAMAHETNRATIEENQRLRERGNRDMSDTREMMIQTRRTTGHLLHAIDDANDAAQKATLVACEVQAMFQRTLIESMFAGQRRWWSQFAEMRI